MTPEISFSGELAESLFLVIRMVLGLAIMAVIAVCVRLAILTFAGTRYHLLGRRKYWWASLCLLAVGVLEGLRRPAEAVLSTLGNWRHCLAFTMTKVL